MFFLLSEASGRLSEALWELSGELSGSWGGHGVFKGILDRKCSKSILFYNKNEKHISVSLRFFGGLGVTSVCFTAT